MPKRYDQFGERLKTAMGDDSPYALAKKSQISNSLIRRYVAGDGLPGTEHLVTLAEITGASIEWLATGNGPMRKDDFLPIEACADGLLAKDAPQPFSITNLEGRQVEYKPAPGLSHIPILTIEAACGLGTIIEGEEISAVFSATESWFKRELGTSSKNLTIIKARGDSMISTIMPEEMVFVDRSTANEPGDGLWVYRFEDAVFLKRLQLLPGRKIKVMSDNQVYTPYELQPDETFRLLGRVIAALPLRRL